MGKAVHTVLAEICSALERRGVVVVEGEAPAVREHQEAR
jgi:hypothetical protein